MLYCQLVKQVIRLSGGLKVQLPRPEKDVLEFLGGVGLLPGVARSGA
jgi:hypothetical protein